MTDSYVASASVRPEPNRVGFSGTRTGMTRAQIVSVYDLLDGAQPGIGHHGDCVGADVDFHSILKNLGWKIVGHPPIKTTLRAYCTCDEWRSPQPYLVRNMDIVNETSRLIATPRSNRPEPAGTWFTIRRAELAGRPGTVVWPDGSTSTISDALMSSGRKLADATKETP